LLRPQSWFSRWIMTLMFASVTPFFDTGIVFGFSSRLP